MANDIRNFDDPNEVTPGNMSSQKIGAATVRSSYKHFKYLSTDQTIVSSESAFNTGIDPNNIVAQYDDRFDDPTYY